MFTTIDLHNFVSLFFPSADDREGYVIVNKRTGKKAYRPNVKSVMKARIEALDRILTSVIDMTQEFAMGTGIITVALVIHDRFF